MDEGVQDGEGGVDGEWPPGDAAGCPRVESSLRALDAAGVLGATFLTGDGGRIVWVSRRFVELTGFDEAQALGRRRGELIAGPFVGSDGFRELEAALVEGRPCALEFPTRTATGRAYWAALELAAVDAGSAPSALCEGCPGCAEGEAGRLVALVGRERDVTAQRLAEERARQALSRAQSLGVALRLEKQLLTSVLGGVPQLVWWKGSDGRYLGCNPSFLRARGLTSLADVIGRLESQLDVHDDLGRQVAEAEAEVGAGRAASVDVPVTLTMADESTVSLLVTISGATAAAGQATPVLPVQPSLAGASAGPAGGSAGPRQPGGGPARSAPGTAPAGAPVTLIGVATDVTRVAALERELAHTERLDSIGRLAAGVAHEINTPIQYVSDNTRFVQAAVQEVLDGLAGIAAAGATQGAVDAAVRECLGRLDLPFLREEVPAALAQAMEGLERVAAVVRAMKAFSDPSSGLLAVDVNDLVRAAVGVAENRWRDVADTRLDLDPAAGQATLYAADLRQALLHLLVNAAQAVEDRLRQAPASHRGTIVVGTRRIEGPGGAEVRIWVGDDGVGMPSHVLQRAFDPFFTTRDVGEGSGQGLSFAHATVVAKHGGRLDVVSEPGSGSTFTMAVPAGVGAG